MAPGEAKQTWESERYARNARFVADLGEPLIAILAPQPGERILDLGCGDGALTEKLAASGASIVGVDAGPDMIAAARRRGLDAHVADGRTLAFNREFDAVFSNAALHWMNDPDAVIAGVARALKPGSRFIGEMGGHLNVAAICVALTTAMARRGIDGLAAIPWYFPSPAEYCERLECGGFAVDRIELIPRPTPLPTGMAPWLETFCETFFRLVPAADRASLRDEVVETLRPFLCDSAGRWTADYVRLRFAAHL